MKQHADLAKTGRVLDEEFEQLRKQPVSARELRAAKNKLLTEHARSIRTNSGMADWLGTYEVYFGDYRALFTAPQAIERVTAADVRRVARQYLLPVESHRRSRSGRRLPRPRQGPAQ